MDTDAPASSVTGPGGVDASQMLATIQRIVEFGVRRPGYAQSLAVERWLEAAWQEAGLTELGESRCRRTAGSQPAPPSPLRTVHSRSRFPIPYTAWTPTASLEAPSCLCGERHRRGFGGGRIARPDCGDLEARFAQLTGSALKQGASFIRDAGQTIPNGPLHAANWLIKNFPAYYEAQKRGAVGFIGLLVDSPTDGCEFSSAPTMAGSGSARCVGGPRARGVRARPRAGRATLAVDQSGQVRGGGVA